jgi:hypothetical protein
MNWLARLVGAGRSQGTEKDPDAPETMERQARPSLGVAAVFDVATPDGRHAVLDLGRASETGMEVYRRYARRIRFADLLPVDGAGTLEEATRASFEAAIPAQPDHPYDLVLAWDVFDRVAPEARAALVEVLADRCAAGARLHVVVDPSDTPTIARYRFTPLDVDRVRYEPAGEAPRTASPLLPAPVERLLDPFEVVRAFTLRSGLREYVAIRR